jgi:acyl transferase domain-containing protein/surfactin synthase thioesterase subunit/aryl carrier-like protein
MSQAEIKYKELLQESLIKLAAARDKIDTLEEREHEPIAIIGLAGRFPGARNVNEFFENIMKGIESLKTFSDRELLKAGMNENEINKKNYVKVKGVLADYDFFDSSFFNYTSKQAALMDPQIRLMLETAWEAMEDAGYFSEVQAGKIGVFTGFNAFSTHITDLLSNLGKTLSPSEIYQLTTVNGADFLSTRISYEFDFTGPSFTLQSACSTSLLAVIEGCVHLLNRKCDMALAGGISINEPMNRGYEFQEGGILSPDGHCRPFDIDAQGTVIGNGLGIVVLKRYQDAVRDHDKIYAVINGFASNNDGSKKVGFTAPSVLQQAGVIEEALLMAGITPDEISLYEAHGTATTLGDPIEIAAATKAYSKYTSRVGYCPIGSVKSNIGHLDTAAGIAGLIKVILAIKNKKIPPSINFKKPNPKIQIENSPFYVSTEISDWEVKEGKRIAAISSFGIGGTNTHVILSEPDLIPESTEKNHSKSGLSILTISAKTEEALNAYIEKYILFLNESDYCFEGIAFNANSRRSPFKYRLAVMAKDSKEAAKKLRLKEFIRGQIEESEARFIHFKHVKAGGYEILPEVENNMMIKIGPETNWDLLLVAISKFYVMGASIDWKTLEQSIHYSTISLPTYPFQRRRYGIEPSAPLFDCYQWLYEWKWEVYTLKNENLPTPLGNWLILCDENVSEALVKIINEKGGNCRCIALKDHPQTKEEFLLLLREKPLSGILHLSSTKEPRKLTEESIKEAQIMGTKSFLHLCQALIQLGGSFRIPTYLVSLNHVVYSPLNGLYKSIIIEYPELDLKYLCLGKNDGLSLLFNALFSRNNEPILKLDNNQCYVPRLVRMKKPSLLKVEKKILSDATYLITGGLSGLGLILAKWLIDKGCGQVVLTGRSEPDEENMRTVQELKARGAEVTYQIVDISNEEEVKHLLSELNKLSKPLKGIFHLASAGDAPVDLMEENWNRFIKAFGPKIYGSFFLHQYSKNLDVFVTFSSLAATLGAPRLCSYATANAFLDGLCEFRNELGLPAQSFSWGPWAVRMSKEEEDRLERAGLLSMKPEKALESLSEALTLSPAQITIADIDWNNYVKNVEEPTWLCHVTEQKSEEANIHFLKNSVGGEDRFLLIKNFVANAVRLVLGVPESQSLDENKDFISLGLDSLSTVTLRHKLISGLEKGNPFLSTPSMKLTDLFANPTILKMSEYLEHHYGQFSKSEQLAQDSNPKGVKSILESPNWIIRPNPIKNPKVRFFGFSGIGGGILWYNSWKGYMPLDIEVNLILLPGRELRINEQPLTNLGLVVSSIVHAIVDLIDIPYIFFGHSAGVLLATEVIRELQKLNLNLPEHAILSGMAPIYFEDMEARKSLSDVVDFSERELEEYIEFRRGPASLPETMLNNKEFMKYYRQIEVADCKLFSKSLRLDEKLKIPITSIHYDNDDIVRENEVKRWRETTLKSYHHIVLPGNHHTVYQNPVPTIEVIKSICFKINPKW